MPPDPSSEHDTEKKAAPATGSSPRKWPGFSVACDKLVVDRFSDLCSDCGISRSEAIREFMRAAILKPTAFKLALGLSTQRGRSFGDQLSELITSQLRILRENGDIK